MCIRFFASDYNLPPDLAKQLFLLISIKTSGIFFQIFVAFSEKLNFNGRLSINNVKVYSLLP